MQYRATEARAGKHYGHLRGTYKYEFRPWRARHFSHIRPCIPPTDGLLPRGRALKPGERKRERERFCIVFALASDRQVKVGNAKLSSLWCLSLTISLAPLVQDEDIAMLPHAIQHLRDRWGLSSIGKRKITCRPVSPFMPTR